MSALKNKRSAREPHEGKWHHGSSPLNRSRLILDPTAAFRLLISFSIIKVCKANLASNLDRNAALEGRC